MTTDDRKGKSIFKGYWLGDYNKPDYEKYPRATPCLVKRGRSKEVGDINFFTSLQRTSSKPFVPTVFEDFAPIILSTKTAVNLPQVTKRRGIIDAWKRNNQNVILLNAVSQLKTTPIKQRRSTAQTIEAEDIKVTKLPNQEDSGDSDEYNDNEEDDGHSYMIEQIQEVDWTNFNFPLPNSRYRARKDESKLEWYQNLVDKCRIRDMFEWMVDQGDNLAEYSTDLVDLNDIKKKLNHWTSFKYRTSQALAMVKKVQDSDNKKQQGGGGGGGGSARASAKPVKEMNTAEIIKTLGKHHDRVINEMADSLNHVLHHTSVLQRCLYKQSKLISSQNPPSALHIFGEAHVIILGLIVNIKHFANKLGVPQDKIIANPKELENCFNKNVLDETKIGMEMNLEDIANITTTMAIKYSLTNLKVFDMKRLIRSIKWHDELAIMLDPNYLLNRVLMFTCNHSAGLHHQYLHVNEKETYSTNIGNLSDYLHELKEKGWTVSFDKIVKEEEFEDDYFFLVSKQLDKFLSTWNPKRQRWDPIGK